MNFTHGPSKGGQNLDIQPGSQRPPAPAGSGGNWTPYAQERPRRDSLVEWITPSGQVVKGRYQGGLVWYPEGSEMYVYYTPTYWRYR